MLARWPLCVDCLALGLVVPSTDADHVVPLPRPNWWDGDWSIDNGRGRCHTCHSRKTATESSGW